jgi:hypothetical protein
MKKAIREFIKHETRRQRAYLWGEYCVFKPVLLKKFWGDGLQFIYFGSIDNRPKWWIARVDSKTNLEADEFNYEEILCAIEDEFGRAPEEGYLTREEFNKIKKSGRLLFDYENYTDYQQSRKYPVIEWTMGGHWGTIKNFGIT